MRLGERMWAESPVYASRRFDPFRVQAVLLRLVDAGGVFVAYGSHVRSPHALGMLAPVTFEMTAPGHLLGFFAGLVTEHPLWGHKTASDVAWYVAPEARASGVGRQLVAAFEGWAASQGATESVLGISTGIDDEAAALLAVRMGYARAGVSYRKVLDCAPTRDGAGGSAPGS